MPYFNGKRICYLVVRNFNDGKPFRNSSNASSKNDPGTGHNPILRSKGTHVSPTDLFRMTRAESMIIYNMTSKDFKHGNFKNYKGRSV
jgi:hypothetical protein